MNSKFIPVIFLGFMILQLSAAAEYDSETLKIKPFLKSKSSCRKCHDPENNSEITADLTRTCDVLCLSCHKDIKKAHHMVGVKIKNNTSHKLKTE